MDAADELACGEVVDPADASTMGVGAFMVGWVVSLPAGDRDLGCVSCLACGEIVGAVTAYRPGAAS